MIGVIRRPVSISVGGHKGVRVIRHAGVSENNVTGAFEVAVNPAESMPHLQTGVVSETGEGNGREGDVKAKDDHKKHEGAKSLTKGILEDRGASGISGGTVVSREAGRGKHGNVGWRE